MGDEDSGDAVTAASTPECTSTNLSAERSFQVLYCTLEKQEMRIAVRLLQQPALLSVASITSCG